RNGGKDNVTVVLVHNDKVPQQHTATAIKQREPASPGAIRQTNEQPAQDDEAEPTATKTNKGIIAVLSVLALMFLASTVYLYLQIKKQDVIPDKQPVAVVSKPADPMQLKLQKAVDNLKGNILILSDTAYKTPIIINDAIKINRDSLLIKAKGHVVFQSDSGYAGAAIKLSAKCKSIVLDSLSFVNFNTGISLANNAVELKNVRFVNVKQSIQNELSFADKKYISGKLPYLVIKADSLPVSNKK
ncbi:MAG: hypothetical protein JWR09_358, partial [Mucilaginibacter sp.]|nr:hypothetical protein [Mucilaginibacter sp.]